MSLQAVAQRHKGWISIVPLWIRIAMIVVSLGIALYWSFEDRGVYNPVARAIGDNRLGFAVSWIVCMLPCIVLVNVLAWLFHRRAKRLALENAIPKAVARERSTTSRG